MRVTYTHHARQRMIQRKVSAEQVIETLESPDELIPGEAGEEIAIKRFGAREVRVVYKETETDSFVIYTVMKPRVRNGR
ncbi:MAG: DUF4258 domain-containing protein [Caldilineales bacterium]|nr:DUF4258 domain-containing protein [Caldilineales bacterium]